MNKSEWNRKVAISRWKNVFDKKIKEIEENSLKYPYLKARLIGYLIGDGSVTIRREKTGLTHHDLCFYPDDDSMLHSFLFAFKKIYSCYPNIKNETNYFRVRVSSKPIVTELLKNASFRSLEWKIPEIIFNSNTNKIEFLRAFYDCEGYVGKRVIAVQSVNKSGLEQIKILLKEFDIDSKLYSYKRKNKNWNTNFLLYVSKIDDRRRFLNKISFNHSIKRKKLQKYAGVA